MKFRLVENIDSGLENESAMDVLDESINTNLRKFLLSLIGLAQITLDIDNPVVHHTKKDRGKNSIDDLVIMSDHDHRSMHAKYRGKEWDDNAHKAYKYIEVKDILIPAMNKLQQISYTEETNVNNEN